MTVLVHYYGGMAEVAGVDEEQFELGAGAVMSDVIDRVVARHPRLDASIGVCTFFVDGRAVPREAEVPGGACVDVLPPFSGG